MLLEAMEERIRGAAKLWAWRCPSTRLAIDLAAEKWVRFAKTASAVLLQSGGGAPASRSCATLIPIDGKQALQLLWRGCGEVHGCEHLLAEPSDPDQVERCCGRFLHNQLLAV